MFVVPKSEGSKKENRFTFKLSERGKTHSVPFLQYIGGEAAEYIESLAVKPVSEATMLRNLIRIECPEAFDEIRKLANDQVAALSVAWAEESEASAGESQASEGS
jgi:hypothetical protein